MVALTEAMTNPESRPNPLSRHSRRGLLAGAAGVGLAAALGVPRAAAASWTNPAVGRITSRYGPRNGTLHAGTDIANSQGTTIRAAGAGTVTAIRTDSYPGDTRAGLLPGRTGNGVIIDHGSGVKTYYGHLHTVSARVGQSVGVGSAIATMGTTGNSTGPHLHIEVHLNGSTTDPQPWFSARGVTLGTGGSSSSGWPSLRSGSSGNVVRVAQHLLNHHGASLLIDGDYGSVTITAAKAFQRSEGLVDDGDLGPVSWPVLVVEVRSGATGHQGRAAQQALNIHGAGLLVDGDFGSVSVNAAKAFQRSKGLVDDGVVGQITWEALV